MWIEIAPIKKKNKGEKMKKLLKKLKKYAGFQLFANPNWVGDEMTLIWSKNGKEVYLCEQWEYIEAFGFSDKKLNKIRDALK